jgi:hypothetical protein
MALQAGQLPTAEGSVVPTIEEENAIAALNFCWEASGTAAEQGEGNSRKMRPDI